MDNMDIDQIMDVPDTPDQVTARVNFDRSGLREENHSHRHSGHRSFFEEVSRDRPIDVESGRKRMLMRRPKGTNSSSNPVYPKRNTEATERPSGRNDVVDLSDRSRHTPAFVNSQREIRKRPALANGASGSKSTNVIPTLLGRAGEGASNEGRVRSIAGNVEGLESSGCVQIRPANINVVHLDSTPSPTINRQKRLVRNGCISPNNIAKANYLPPKEESASVTVVQNTKASTGSSAPSGSIDIMDLVAEDNNSGKGKGKAVLSQPCPSKDVNANIKHSHSRSSLSLSERLRETNDHARDDFSVMEDSSGWRSTRNRHRKTNLSLFHEDQAVIREANDPSFAGQQLHNRRGRGDKDTGIPSSHSSRQSESSSSARLSQLSSHQSINPVRLKPRSASSSFNECSTSARNDPEVVLITSPVEPSTSRSTSRRADNSKRVIEAESTPEPRHNIFADEARMRQLEADERLARELQEQLYSETPAVAAEEFDFDDHIALALQQQDSSAHGPSRSTRQRASSFVSDLRRESQLRSNAHRAFQSRASNVGRTTRSRSRFPGVPRAVLPSSRRSSVFPADMDIDMRMHILGTLEAFSDMGVAPGLLQTQRDFNENDYEMLLALDENNDRHGGASARVINGLPESTVQNDNYDEACAVCLETPTIGDTIRHLPCLHKFHKDCIDPWLRRKTSCPVCKSSVT